MQEPTSSLLVMAGSPHFTSSSTHSLPELTAPLSCTIKVDGEIVGAIGVSGAPAVRNDVDCAKAALALVRDALPAD